MPEENVAPFTLEGGETIVPLIARRERMGMSQAQLARALGVSVNTIARWERGDLKVQHPTILRLALERLEQTVGDVPSR